MIVVHSHSLSVLPLQCEDLRIHLWRSSDLFSKLVLGFVLDEILALISESCQCIRLSDPIVLTVDFLEDSCDGQ